MREKHLLDGQISNLFILEDIYQKYQKEKTNSEKLLDYSWSLFFQSIESQKVTSIDLPNILQTKNNAAQKIEKLIEAYRKYGYLAAKTNPIENQNLADIPELQHIHSHFSAEEKEKSFPTLGLLPEKEASLQKIIAVLQQQYARKIGIEYQEFVPEKIRNWMQESIENNIFPTKFMEQNRKNIFLDLLKAEFLEMFLHTKYVGQKRFSLEGAETLIPMLTTFIRESALQGVEEIILGMSHRGRLNVVANVLNKPLLSFFQEFNGQGNTKDLDSMGDVKYHKGYSNPFLQTDPDHSIKITLSPNPSHLESVNSVVEGMVRAKQVAESKTLDYQKFIPFLIHGDAAIAGQGTVYETLQLSHLNGFKTGGTIHVIINNHIGFTTLPKDARSTLYCTDIAHTFGIPILHVNAEDVENCLAAIVFALHIRQKFHSDVFIDLNCYRKYGHNESDEPVFTQPTTYSKIKTKESIYQFYKKELIEKKVIDSQMVKEQEDAFKKSLQQIYEQTKEEGQISLHKSSLKETYSLSMQNKEIETFVPKNILVTIAEKISTIPEDLKLHPKLEKSVHENLQLVLEDKPLPWGLVENLAYGSLLWENISVRLSGQDSGRGTFSHRHALWVDQQTAREYYPLAHLKESQGRLDVINSPLSEMAVLGFEYGYSIGYPQGLTIWEAQFGDFVNGAQVIVDQYIASGEQKWEQKSGLVLYLPHGYEGQGPEHSSGRMERFLALAGHNNMQIVNPTSPAQFFHVLRRQIKQKQPKPLIIFTPKGLLRHPRCMSSLDDLSRGGFHTIIDDPQKSSQQNRIVICSGRIYYDLLAYREKENCQNVAIIRLEQIYPLNKEKLLEILQSYPKDSIYIWVQEEPKNMGAWLFIQDSFFSQLSLQYMGRERSATPATGSYSKHLKEQENILKQVFQR